MTKKIFALTLFMLAFSNINDLKAQITLDCGVVKTDSLPASVEERRYTIEADSGDVLTFHLTTLSSSFSIQMQLLDQDETVLVSGRQNMLITLENGGSFTLLVNRRTSSPSEGTFSIYLQKLNDPCRSTDLVCGAMVRDSLSGRGQYKSYRFTGNQGEVRYFSAFDPDRGFNTYIDLYDAKGRRVDRTTSNMRVILPLSGVYTVFVYYSSGRTTAGIYEFTMENPRSACNATSLSCGETFKDSLSSGGAINVYTFSAQASEGFYFEPQNNSSQFRVRMLLFDPKGEQIYSSTSQFNPILERAGTYTLIVQYSSGSDNSGAYEIYFQSITNACNAIHLSCYQTLSDSLENRMDFRSYTFDAKGGDRYFFNLMNASGSFRTNMELFDPTGIKLLNNYSTTSTTLIRTGTYTIVVGYQSGGEQSGQYHLSYENTLTPCRTTPIDCGASVIRTIDTIGQLDVLNFDGQAGDVILLDIKGLSSDFAPALNLFDPDGLPISTSRNILSERLIRTGTYTAIVKYNSGTSFTGEYGLTVQKANGGCASTFMPCGQPESGVLEGNVQQRAYHFEAQAGEMLALRLADDSPGTNFTFDLYDPAAEVLASRKKEFFSFLPRSGVYTVIVKNIGQSDIRGSFVLNRQNTHNACLSTQISCGEIIAGFLSARSNLPAYTFEASAGDVIYLQLVNTINARMELYDPDGQFLEGNQLKINKRLGQAGTYTLLITSATNGISIFNLKNLPKPAMLLPLMVVGRMDQLLITAKWTYLP